MLNLKKVIASVCVLAMVLSTVAFGATYTDVAEESAYYEAVETLNKLDIITGYEDGTFKPEDGVTRAEMAALIARIQGYGDTAKGSANTGFTDVPASHWASGYIANAAGMGIINGYGDGTFGPDDPVLYEQAVKMVMATLGYTPFAEKNGGYPTGYLAAAQRYSVSLAVANAVVGQDANRGTVAQLLVNALDTPLMIQNAWNTNGEVEYIIADGTGTRTYRTLMSENLGYVKIRGIVTENSITALSSAKSIDTTKDAEVVINVRDSYKTTNKDYAGIDSNDSLTWANKTILANGTDVEDYLGQSVIGYIKKLATDKYEMVSVAVDTNRNDVLTINLADYDSISGNIINYYKDGANDTTEARVEATTIPVVFNGTGNYTAANIAGIVGSSPVKFGGEIVLVDNDTDKGYDVAFINMAATAVVKKVTSNGISLYNPAKIGGSGNTRTLYVYPDDETKVFTVTKDGAEIDYTELNEWDVLSVYAASATSNVMTAEVISSEVVGTITSTKVSKTSNFTISGKDYAFKVGENWYDVASGAYQEGLEVGAGGKFYIDQFGKIAAFIEDAALAGGSAGNYGYVLAVAAEEKSFGSAGNVDVKVQMLTADGVEVLTIKNNAKFNEATSTSTQLDITNWVWVDGNSDNKVTANEVKSSATGSLGDTKLGTLDSGTVEGKVVKYTKDSNGYLSSITLAGYSKSGDAEFATVNGSAQTNQEFDADTFKLGGIYITDDAMVFVVDADEANCKIVSAADLGDKDKYTVNASYQTKSSDDADLIVITASTFNGTSVTSNVAVITGVSTGVDDENNTVYTLTFLQDGEEKTLSTTEDVYNGINGWITIGDVVKVKTTGDVISNVSKVFDFDDGVRNTTVDSTDKTATDMAFTKGSVGSDDEVFKGGKVTVYKDSAELAKIENTELKLGKGVNYYTIDTTGANTVITAEGGSTFNNLSDAIYDGSGTNDICDKNGNAYSALTGLSDAEAQVFADYVFVRTYEGKVIDVIVVKGPKNIIIK